MLKDRRTLALAAVAVAAAIAAVGMGVAALTQESGDSEARTAVFGDADCNQVVNALDALAALSVAAGGETAAACVHEAGDVNCNEAIDVGDAVLILQYSALREFRGSGEDGCPGPGTVIATPSLTATPTESGDLSPTPTPTATPGVSASQTPPSTGGATASPVTPTEPPVAPCGGPGGGPTLPA